MCIDNTHLPDPSLGGSISHHKLIYEEKHWPIHVQTCLTKYLVLRHKKRLVLRRNNFSCWDTRHFLCPNTINFLCWDTRCNPERHLSDFLSTAPNGIIGWEFIRGSTGSTGSTGSSGSSGSRPRTAARNLPSTRAGGKDGGSSQTTSLKLYSIKQKTV